MAYRDRTDEEIIAVLEEWVAKHPSPDTIVCSNSDSPRKFVEKIKTQNDPEGFLAFLRSQGKEFNVDPLDYIHQMIRSNT